MTAIRRPPYALLTGSALAITCFFNAAYVNADIERYYLGPALIAWTWLADPRRDRHRPRSCAGLGGDARRTHAPGRGRPARGVTQVAAAGDRRGPAPRPDGASTSARARPPSTGRTTAAPRRWLDEVLGEVEQDAMIVSWWSYSTPLWYAQLIEGRRPDIFVVDDRTRLDLNLGDLTTVIDSNLGERPVYAIRSDQNEMRLLLEPLQPDAARLAARRQRLPRDATT